MNKVLNLIFYFDSFIIYGVVTKKQQQHIEVVRWVLKLSIKKYLNYI